MKRLLKWFAVGGLAVVVLVVTCIAIVRGTPSFCSVHFGTTEVIFGFTVDSVLIYRDANSPPEKYSLQGWSLIDCDAIPPFRDGDAVFTVTGISCQHIEGKPIRPFWNSVEISATVQDDKTTYKQYCNIVLSPTRAQLSYSQFDGPLKVVDAAGVGIKRKIEKGKQQDLKVMVRSFNNMNGCGTAVQSHTNENYGFPVGVVPVATIEFPTAGNDEPVVERFKLDKFC